MSIVKSEFLVRSLHLPSFHFAKEAPNAVSCLAPRLKQLPLLSSSSSTPLSVFHRKFRSQQCLSHELVAENPSPWTFWPAEINVTDRLIDSKIFFMSCFFYLKFLNDQTCGAGDAQSSGNIKAPIPLSLQVAHSHSSVYHWTVALITQGSNKPHPSSFRDLPASTLFVGAMQNAI